MGGLHVLFINLYGTVLLSPFIVGGAVVRGGTPPRSTQLSLSEARKVPGSPQEVLSQL